MLDDAELAARYTQSQSWLATLPKPPPYFSKKLSVIIPSRLGINPATGEHWVKRAILNVMAQNFYAIGKVQIIVALDRGLVWPKDYRLPNLKVVYTDRKTKPSLPAAINAGVKAAKGEVLAFLEDDDTWHPDWLALAVRWLTHFEFVSTVQSAVTAEQQFNRMILFSNPSTWVMRRQTWQKTGAADPNYHLHFDGDWLGRMNQAGCKRGYLLPTQFSRNWNDLLKTAPYFMQTYQVMAPGSTIIHTDLPYTFVNRTETAESFTAQINQDPIRQAESEKQLNSIIERFSVNPH